MRTIIEFFQRLDLLGWFMLWASACFVAVTIYEAICSFNENIDERKMRGKKK